MVSVSMVRPRWWREFSTMAMWLEERYLWLGEGDARQQVGRARLWVSAVRRARVRRPTRESELLRRTKPASPTWIESQMDSKGT